MTSDKPLPKSVEYEKHVISCFLSMDEEQDRIKACIGLLSPEDFTDAGCRKMYSAVRELISRGESVDVMSVNNLTQDHSIANYDLSITTVLLENRITALKLYTVQRKAIIEGGKFLTAIYSVDDPISEIKSIGERFISISESVNIDGDKIVDADKIKATVIGSGISSGFVTHDYNDSGLKGGCLTITTGYRGDGKSTICRQMAMACAMQGISVFNFIGESKVEEEKTYFARLCSIPGELTCSENIGGRKIYELTQTAEDRFNNWFSGRIKMCDTSITSKYGQLFNTVLNQMYRMADTGVKLFILDSMTVLNQGADKAKFSEQERIIKTLKDFTVKYDVHVNLVAHQSKGQTRVSGVSIQEDLADTILRYVRVREDRKVLKNISFSDDIKSQITAMVLNEKVRSLGTQFPMFMIWDGVRGACIEVTDLPKSMEYEDNKLWVKSIHKYDSDDIPTIQPENLPYKD